MSLFCNRVSIDSAKHQIFFYFEVLAKHSNFKYNFNITFNVFFNKISTLDAFDFKYNSTLNICYFKGHFSHIIILICLCISF